jgi:hypothetical protein
MTPTEKMLKKMGISLVEFGEILTDEDVIDTECEIIENDDDEEE